ncbi:MAG TPA: chloride channel protein [Dehalococcoidales bacterium]|nr:chloride channel protein [Dehalococcoidales bacterium]
MEKHIPKKGLAFLFDLRHASYIRKWFTISLLIGIVAGLGSILFYWLIQEVTRLALGTGAGYFPPVPTGEGGTTVFSTITRTWMIPIITTLGGLISGVIVFKFAPEAEGHGTDAAIDAFHNKGGAIRRRVPIVKMITAAVTIGTGGSAGREGPTAQIAAGAGSALADLFNLSAHDRRIALAAGIGAGIGSIFKAPLGGAILSMEILYRRDFETEALLPSFISSVIGYSIFSMWAGWTPIFGAGTVPPFNHVRELIAYAILGVLCGLVGIAYGRSFYAIRNFFKIIRIPNWVKPAIGGLLVGIAGMFLPQLLGTGYGWLQFAIDGNFTYLSIGILVAVIIGKILATGLTIGSGGSGGVFAPGLVIGGMTGALFWSLLHNVTNIVPSSPAAFVVVGMMALFGGIAKVPLAVILMVSEMTQDYSLLVPSMLACTVAYFVTSGSYLYENQVPTKVDSPAHKAAMSVPLLKRLKIIDFMKREVVIISPDTTIQAAVDLMRKKKVDAVPVLDDGRLVGIVASRDVAIIPRKDWPDTLAKSAMKRELILGYDFESLHSALDKMTKNNISHLLIVNSRHPNILTGIIAIKDIALSYENYKEDLEDENALINQ